MAPATTQPLAVLLESMRPVVTMEREGLVITALEANASAPATDYLTFGEAIELGAVQVHEFGAGSVPHLVVQTGPQPVVVYAGDTVLGGLQDRVVNVTIWLPPARATTIPVTCIEHGRWHSRGDTGFGLGPRADTSLRAMVYAQVAQHRTVQGEAQGFASDQQAVWGEISARHARAQTASDTGTLQDVYERERSILDDAVGAFPYPAATLGVAVGIGGRIVSLETFDRPITGRRLWGRTVEAAVRAWLDYQRLVDAKALPKPAHRFPDREALDRMKARVAAALADAIVAPSVGEGHDVRLRTDKITGGALVRDGALIHAEVHRTTPWG
jgi:hypothetical protein